MRANRAANEPLVRELPGRLLDIDALSEYLGVPVKSIYDMTYRRQIPFIKIGQRLRFRPAEIDAWLESQSTRPPK